MVDISPLSVTTLHPSCCLHDALKLRCKTTWFSWTHTCSPQLGKGFFSILNRISFNGLWKNILIYCFLFVLAEFINTCKDLVYGNWEYNRDVLITLKRLMVDISPLSVTTLHPSCCLHDALKLRCKTTWFSWTHTCSPQLGKGFYSILNGISFNGLWKNILIYCFLFVLAEFINTCKDLVYGNWEYNRDVLITLKRLMVDISPLSVTTLHLSCCLHDALKLRCKTTWFSWTHTCSPQLGKGFYSILNGISFNGLWKNILIYCFLFVLAEFINTCKDLVYGNWNYKLINALWSSDAIWRHRSWSTLDQVMAVCLWLKY